MWTCERSSTNLLRLKPSFSVLVQVYRFRHWLADKVDYKCSFKNKGTAGFECRPAVAATPAGPEGSEVEVEVVFEPTAVGEGFRDVLVLSSPAGGEYECAVVGRCLPPKPQGPIEMVKVRDPVAWALANLHYFIRSGFQWAFDGPQELLWG